MPKYITMTRWPVWVACLAVLLNAFAPSVSHAVAASRDAALAAPICRAGGLAVAAARQPAQNAADAHCAYCLAHAGSFALPPAAPAALEPGRAHRALASPAYRSALPLTVWPDARPRAPPAPA